jgi:DNA modification methylase
MGSGSTGVAAVREGHGFIGVDNDTEHGYCNIAYYRIKHATEA